MEGFGVIVLSRAGVLDEFPVVLDGTLLRMKIKVGDAQGDGAGSVDGPNIQFPGGGGDAGLEDPDSGGRWNGCCLGKKLKTERIATHGFSTGETPSLGVSGLGCNNQESRFSHTKLSTREESGSDLKP